MDYSVLSKAVSLVLIGYLPQALPALPSKVAMLFKNSLFALIYLAVIVYLGTGRIVESLVASVVMFIILKIVSSMESFEAYDEVALRDGEMYGPAGADAKFGYGEMGVKNMMKDIAQKAQGMQNYYLSQCPCPQNCASTGTGKLPSEAVIDSSILNY